MIVYCQKTRQVYNTDLKFQLPLKAVWSTVLQQSQTKHLNLANDIKSRTPDSK